MTTEAYEMLFTVCREWNDSLCDDACSSLIKEMKICLDAPGGRPEFRCALTASFFLKFYLTVKNEINEISEMLLSATKPFHRELTKASQGFQVSELFEHRYLQARQQVIQTALFSCMPYLAGLEVGHKC